MNDIDTLRERLSDHRAVFAEMDALLPAVAEVAEVWRQCIANGNKIILMGNGGSAADSQHIAAEIVGRYKKERRGLPAISLTVDTSALTAIGNDYGFDAIFSRQVEAHCNPGDVVVGISTSGNSSNVIRAIEKAKELGGITVLLSGGSGGKLAAMCDYRLIMPSHDTPRVQEAHIFVYHSLCELLEAKLVEASN